MSRYAWDVGEQGRLELTRAEAEQARARFAVRGAQLKLATAIAQLRISIAAPADAALDPQGTLEQRVALPALVTLRAAVLSSHPSLRESQTNVKAANANLDHERALRLPQPNLFAEFENQPDLRFLAGRRQSVRAGSVLALLHSNDLSTAQLALVKAHSQQALDAAATGRAEQLVAADVIGRAELEKRRAEQLQADAEAASYRTELRGLGMGERQIRQLETTSKLNAEYPIIAPRSGMLLERKVAVGQVLQPADLAFRIADLSTVWIVADVPEQEAGSLRKGVEVTVHVPALHAVGGVVLMTSGGNAKEIVSRVKERVATINSKHMIPGGLEIVPYYDRSQLVDAAIHTVTEVLGEGVLLVVVVLCLFLGDLRSSLS